MEEIRAAGNEDAAKEKEFGHLPLHRICKNKSATVELVRAVHELYPDAAKIKDTVRRLTVCVSRPLRRAFTPPLRRAF